MAKPLPSALFPTISHSKKRALLLAYAETGRLREACRAAAMDHKLHYYWKRTDPDYAAAYEDAQQIAGELLEEEAIRRARGWDETRYALDGTPYQVTKHSDTLLIFLMKGAMPQKYGDRVKVAHTGANEQEFVLKVIYANERPGPARAPDRSADSPQSASPAPTAFLIQPGEA